MDQLKAQNAVYKRCCCYCSQYIQYYNNIQLRLSVPGTVQCSCTKDKSPGKTSCHLQNSYHLIKDNCPSDIYNVLFFFHPRSSWYLFIIIYPNNLSLSFLESRFISHSLRMASSFVTNDS